MSNGFPDNFLWGAATAAYQIEGAVAEDGRGRSVWDDFSHRPGAVWQNQTGDVACDHYHRVAEDVGLMRELGLNAYRFSIAWPRVMPAGRAPLNPAGLDFYDRLVDRLLEAGIRPFATLFHWDLPSPLHERGGWLNRDIAGWFGDYAEAVARRLGDRVADWMTVNEPQSFLGAGYQLGQHAPGEKLPWAQILQANHNVLRAHGRAVQALRAHARPDGGRALRIGYVPVAFMFIPDSEDPADIEAARAESFAATERTCNTVSLFIDPIFFGRYPEDALEAFAGEMPEIHPGDMELISQPVDFLPINFYYSHARVRAGRGGRPERIAHPVGMPLTSFGWTVTPELLYWGPRFVAERYRVPLMITENGMANADVISPDGQVHDPQRIAFLARYLGQLRRACAEGVDVQGYFCWSLMDNFEWAEGYKQRFGLYYTDYPTQRRIAKDSARWYRQVIESNGVQGLV